MEFTRLKACASIALTLMLLSAGGCSSSDPSGSSSSPLYAWLQYGVEGLEARAIVDAGTRCPLLWKDGVAVEMSTRARDGTDFPVISCASPISNSVESVRVGSMDFPRFSTSPERVVVLGDTGCRIATGWYQNCSGSGTGTPWNFAEVATAVAVEKPDLIVHVGDFVYREAECDADAQPGCRGSPWGDKWDTWETDFFSPAAPLLRVAPWIVTRGNHEDCGRNHLGWLRFLDGRTLTDSDLTDEGCPLIPDPYKVGFEDLDVLVMDTSTSPSADLDPSPQERYADDFTQAAALVNQGRTTWSVTHRAFWGIFPDWRNPSVLEVADPILQAAISMMPNGGWPSEVKLALAGHIHLFEILSFPDSRPQQVISGGGGTARDAAITSEAIDGNPEVFAQLGITPDDFESYREFGYVLLERLPAGGWSLRVKELDGVQVEQFSLR